MLRLFKLMVPGPSLLRIVVPGAVNSSLVTGDVVGVHVRGYDVTFSKNGAPIPGKMRRAGPVYMAVQLCSPGDQVTIIKSSIDIHMYTTIKTHAAGV